MKLFIRLAVASGLVVLVAAAAFAQAPKTMTPRTRVKGYTKMLKSGTLVRVKGYTRKVKPTPKTAVKGYMKTLKSGKTVSVKGYTRKAPPKGMMHGMAPKPTL